MGKYSSSPLWSSLTPIPLDDGAKYYAQGSGSGEDGDETYPLATITYTEDYAEATAYLRGVMAANEMSERALELTADVIMLNPAHYTVWLYRAKIIQALKKDLREEIAWLNKISLKHLKNYQIWHHRQLIMSDRETFPDLPESEQDFLGQMFSLDSKNYHVWTYRHWLVRHFALWDCPRELSDVENLIDSDVRNNSAWNHRWVLKFGPRGDKFDSGMPNPTDQSGNRGRLEIADEDIVDTEIEYAKSKIVLAPENRSPWAYVRGVLHAAGRPMAELKTFASRFVVEEVQDGDTIDYQVKSSLAMEWLADTFAEEAKEGCRTETAKCKIEAVKMLTLLKEKYDPIRKNYWDYRIHMIKNH
ncbi:farnesyltransferase alpha subunit [Coccidioides immitis RS]|uniref:Protein farnesyltransferase/geranylgeranyltransferase type-1 subunit alpha n=1 Tax=Coccidioides immitis (strain RS) TaxID=246410 RepID=J3K6M6_COCIM|nr:farnesyltransferase alpha subunit [Coccidioides immitis RS]EAS30248.3 farnesyltransferase alpha subunit [Coccidioides immitis RS]